MSRPPVQPAFISTQVRAGRYLFLDFQPRPGAELCVVCAGREDCAPGYRVERESFRYHAVEYVVSGQWELTLGSTRRLLGAGDVFAYGPGVSYTLAAVSPSGLVKCFVDFAGRKARGLLRKSGLAAGQVQHVQQTRWIHGLLDQLLDCAHLSRPSARVISSRLTELLLLRIREDIRLGPPSGSAAQRTYVRCREFVQQRYPTLRSVAEVASGCGLEAAYLSRLCKRFAGETPWQMITRLKMDHAADLLLRRGSTVKQAAAAVGYEDPYHFSRVFKRVQGVAPGRFGRR